MDYINEICYGGAKDYLYEIETGVILVNSSSTVTIVTFTLTTIGLAISTSSLILLILTAIIFEEWRRNYKNRLLIQFMIARFVYTMLRYLNDITRTFELLESQYGSKVYLGMVAAIYSEMALVLWMFLFSRQMYFSLVKVFDVEETTLWKVSIVAWLSPAVVSLIVNLFFSSKRNMDIQIYAAYFFTVKWPLLFTNAWFLIVTMKSLLSNTLRRKINNKRIALTIVTLVFSFCFQQVIVDIYKLVYMILIYKFTEVPCILRLIVVFYNILSLYLCGFSIFFWVFGNKRTRNLWKCIGKEVPKIPNRLSTRISFI